MPENKTRQDAYERMFNARLGAFIDATDDFLLALHADAHAFADEIRAELVRRMRREQPATEED